MSTALWRKVVDRLREIEAEWLNCAVQRSDLAVILIQANGALKLIDTHSELRGWSIRFFASGDVWEELRRTHRLTFIAVDPQGEDRDLSELASDLAAVGVDGSGDRFTVCGPGDGFDVDRHQLLELQRCITEALAR